MDEVKVTETRPDRVEVMRTWTIEAPDWTPNFRTRVIAPRTISVVWVDGEVDRVAISGPYRMKSGKEAQPKYPRDESHIGGTGNPDYRVDWHRMEYYRPNSEDYPAWVPQFIADHTPERTPEGTPS